MQLRFHEIFFQFSSKSKHLVKAQLHESMIAPSEKKLTHCVIYLFAVFQDLDLVLTASGLVVKVRCPFAFGAHVLVVVQFAQLFTRFFWTDHGYHGLMMLRWRTHLKSWRKKNI